MNKTLKFDPRQIPLIFNGSKTSTWRLWDDKDLKTGDIVDFLNGENKEKICTVELTKVMEKPFKDLVPEDMFGHETYDSQTHMLEAMQEIYKKPVTVDTVVKICWYKILKPNTVI